MEDNRKEQIEALETLVEFNDRLVKNMQILVKELSGERLDDTNQFMKSIIDAMNWEIQVVNGTLEVLNEGKERINKEIFNAEIIELSKAIESGNDSRMSDEFVKIIPVFEKLGECAREVIA